MSTINNDFLYIEIEFMSYDSVTRQIVLKTKCDDLPPSLPPNYPVYINFVQSDQLQAGTGSKQTQGAKNIENDVTNFFDQFYYTLNQDVDGNYMLNALFKVNP